MVCDGRSRVCMTLCSTGVPSGVDISLTMSCYTLHFTVACYTQEKDSAQSSQTAGSPVSVLTSCLSLFLESGGSAPLDAFSVRRWNAAVPASLLQLHAALWAASRALLGLEIVLTPCEPEMVKFNENTC